MKLQTQGKKTTKNRSFATLKTVIMVDFSVKKKKGTTETGWPAWTHDTI